MIETQFLLSPGVDLDDQGFCLAVIALLVLRLGGRVELVPDEYRMVGGTRMNGLVSVDRIRIVLDAEVHPQGVH